MLTAEAMAAFLLCLFLTQHAIKKDTNHRIGRRKPSCKSRRVTDSSRSCRHIAGKQKHFSQRPYATALLSPHNDCGDHAEIAELKHYHVSEKLLRQGSVTHARDDYMVDCTWLISSLHAHPKHNPPRGAGTLAVILRRLGHSVHDKSARNQPCWRLLRTAASAVVVCCSITWCKHVCPWTCVAIHCWGSKRDW